MSAAVPSSFHQPVMLEEALSFLRPAAGETHVDCTVGLGGHSVEILCRIAPEGLLVAIDRDRNALARAAETLGAVASGKCRLIHDTFGSLRAILEREGLQEVDGILADLGASSPQLDDAARGMSYRRDGPLDFRMDPTQGAPLSEHLARLDERELADIIRRYGEEPRAKRIARSICRARRRAPIRTTAQLAEVVSAAAGGGRRGLHPARRTFMSLRAWLNQEPEQLREFLSCVPECLSRGGRLVIIAYHSLEDRPVKLAMREWSQGGEFRLLTRRAVKAAPAEVEANPRSRSGRLRAAIRL